MNKPLLTDPEFWLGLLGGAAVLALAVLAMFAL